METPTVWGWLQTNIACVRGPALRPDPAQAPRLEAIRQNLDARIAEVREHGWLGEIAGLQVSRAAAEQKLAAMQQLAANHRTTHLGMPDYRPVAGRTSTSLPIKEDRGIRTDD